MVKYWTVSDKNFHSVGFEGLLLWNRLLWIGVGCLILAFAYMRFSFAERRTRASKTEPEVKMAFSPQPATFAGLRLSDSAWAKFTASVENSFYRNGPQHFFHCDCGGVFAQYHSQPDQQRDEGYGNSTLPVTYWVLDLIRGTLYLFLLIVITYYAGVLVWKDRDEHMDEIADATSDAGVVSYASRLVTLVAMVLLIQFAALLGGMAVQAAHGYKNFQFGLYLYELLVRDGSFFVMLAVLAFFIHVFSPNKYLGYFIYVAFLAINTFALDPPEHRDPPGAVWRHAEHRIFRFLRGCALSPVVELVHPVLAAVLRAAGRSQHHVLAARKAGPMERPSGQCRPAFQRGLESRHAGLPAGIYRRRRLDSV